MRIDAQDALRRLQSSKNLANLSVPDSCDFVSSVPTARHEIITHAHRLGRPNVPEVLRNIIGSVAESSGQSCREVGEAFGVSRASAQEYKTGSIGGKPPTAERAAQVEQRKLEIKDTALLKLMSSLNLIDEEKLAECSAKELAGVAANMSKVVNSLAENNSPLNGVNVVVYAPQIREESKFKVVEI